MQETHQTIQKYLANKSWTDTQDEELIKSLTQVETVLGDVTTYLYIMVNYFEQYVHAVQTSPLFVTPSDSSENDDVSNGPTQTSPAPANRAERRATKRQTPLERVAKK